MSRLEKPQNFPFSDETQWHSAGLRSDGSRASASVASRMTVTAVRQRSGAQNAMLVALASRPDLLPLLPCA
eukprot:4850856-Pleurochrysis_carterae.AAC.3